MSADFMINTNWFFIIPTIAVNIDSLQYVKRSTSVEFHWLIFHARVIKYREEDNE